VGQWAAIAGAKTVRHSSRRSHLAKKQRPVIGASVGDDKPRLQGVVPSTVALAPCVWTIWPQKLQAQAATHSPMIYFVGLTAVASASQRKRYKKISLIELKNKW